jgi:hypothetical protein
MLMGKLLRAIEKREVGTYASPKSSIASGTIVTAIRWNLGWKEFDMGQAGKISVRISKGFGGRTASEIGFFNHDSAMGYDRV